MKRFLRGVSKNVKIITTDSRETAMSMIGHSLKGMMSIAMERIVGII